MDNEENKSKDKLKKLIKDWEVDVVGTSSSSNEDDEQKKIGRPIAGEKEFGGGKQPTPRLKINQPRRSNLFTSNQDDKHSELKEENILNLYKRKENSPTHSKFETTPVRSGTEGSGRSCAFLSNSFSDRNAAALPKSDNSETPKNSKKRFSYDNDREDTTLDFEPDPEDTEDDIPLVRPDNGQTSKSSRKFFKQLSSGDAKKNMTPKYYSKVGEHSRRRRSTPLYNDEDETKKDITPIKTDTFYGHSSTSQSPQLGRCFRMTRSKYLRLSPNSKGMKSPIIDVSDSDSETGMKVEREASPPPLVSQHVSEVRVSTEVMEVCWVHALSNEKQEIMGMLIGDVQGKVVNIRSLKVGKRSTKESLRVEVDSNELIEAMEVASALKNSDGNELRVIGWYHSHPHVTVLPSHVDIRTQAGYQTMDNQFVGLIFSVFWSDKANKTDQREVVAFQSGDLKDDGSRPMIQLPIVIDSTLSRINKPVFVSVYTAKSDTFNKLAEEEIEEYNKHKSSSIQDKVTEMHNEAQLAIRLANIHKFMIEPICKELDFKLKIATSSRQNAEKSTTGELDHVNNSSTTNENKTPGSKKTSSDSVLAEQRRNVLKGIENSPRSSKSDQDLPSSKRVKTDRSQVVATMESGQLVAKISNANVEAEDNCSDSAKSEGQDQNFPDGNTQESNESHTYTASQEF